jgi:hypothetical protein
VTWANTRVTARLDFATEIDVAAEDADIFVIDILRFVGAEFADFSIIRFAWCHFRIKD